MCIKYEASGEKDMHKSGWMAPPKPYDPKKDSNKAEPGATKEKEKKTAS